VPGSEPRLASLARNSRGWRMPASNPSDSLHSAADPVSSAYPRPNPDPHPGTAMKITDVRTIPLRGATHDTGWPGGTDPNEQMNTLLEIRTDEGLTGIGSCFTCLPFVEASLTHLKPMLVDETVFEAERVGEKLRQHSFWYGRGGAVEHTISGLDIALWDLMGKALDQPVSRLLGGNHRDRIKPYASILFDDPPRLREKLQQQVDRGFRAIKMGWRPFRSEEHTSELQSR